MCVCVCVCVFYNAQHTEIQHHAPRVIQAKALTVEYESGSGSRVLQEEDGSLGPRRSARCAAGSDPDRDGRSQGRG